MASSNGTSNGTSNGAGSSHGRLAKKIAVVTGGSSGIGRAICAAFASEGAHVVVADILNKSRNPAEMGTSTVDVVKAAGSDAVFVKVDVSDDKSVDALIAAAVEKFGRVDIMVNCAGIAMEAGEMLPIWDVPNERWDKTIGVNGSGVFYGVRAAARQMRTQEPHPSGDRGWIINLASVLGLVGSAGAVSYTSSKHLVLGLTKSSALDLAADRVHVNAICPGYTRSAMTNPLFENPQLFAMLTAQHPFRGLGETEDIARAAVFLASDDARWVSGIGLAVDGGFTVM